jgi:hypothetical protein
VDQRRLHGHRHCVVTMNQAATVTAQFHDDRRTVA